MVGTWGSTCQVPRYLGSTCQVPGYLGEYMPSARVPGKYMPSTRNILCIRETACRKVAYGREIIVENFREIIGGDREGLSLKPLFK